MESLNLVLGIIGCLTGVFGSIVGGIALRHQLRQSKLSLELTAEIVPFGMTIVPHLKVVNKSSFTVVISNAGWRLKDGMFVHHAGSAYRSSRESTRFPFELESLRCAYIPLHHCGSSENLKIADAAFVRTADGTDVFMTSGIESLLAYASGKQGT